MFDAGVLQDQYPLRNVVPDDSGAIHSLRYRAADLRKIRKLFTGYCKEFEADEAQISIRSERSRAFKVNRPALQMIAREFARFTFAYQLQHAQKLSRRHIDSAFGLTRRWLECVPGRQQRIEIAGLAAAALAASGMRVHLLIENDLALPGVQALLVPVFERLGYAVMCVEAGMEEAKRARAYRQPITIVSARECAMDFLRDSVKWPGKGNQVERKLDLILGARSHHQNSLLRGLPCAVLIDADSTLIDNARAPIALTRDAHPMHEIDELKQALEMVSHLQDGQHYELTGEGAEVALTDLGQRQLQAWADELSGGWRVNNVAQLMLAIAIVVTRLLEENTHYRINGQQVEWLLDERLVPGMVFYSRPFLSRMLALHAGCKFNEQREVAARASYQQIFNRYLHLSGLSHSTYLIETEFRKVYGLKSGHRWRESRIKPFHSISLLSSPEEKSQKINSRLQAVDENSAILLLTMDAAALQQLQAQLQVDFPELLVLKAEDAMMLSNRIKPGALLLAQNNMAEYQAQFMRAPPDCRLEIISTQRSARCAEDLRSLFWMQNGHFQACERQLMLAVDDEIFSETSLYGFQNMVRFSGRKIASVLIERRIQRIQSIKARSLFQMRQQLLAHDETMQGLLSFSGRGLYD